MLIILTLFTLRPYILGITLDESGLIAQKLALILLDILDFSQDWVSAAFPDPSSDHII
jgi:hypothetical protein